MVMERPSAFSGGRRLFQKREQVTVIGLQSAALCQKASELLGFDFVDLDEAVSAACDGKPPSEILATLGVDALRKIETDCYLAAVGSGAKVSKIIACSEGIAETARGRTLLMMQRPVILLERHIEDIVKMRERCSSTPSTPKGSRARAPSKDVPTKQMRRYAEVADFRFPVARGDEDLESLARTLARFVNRVFSHSPLQLVSDSFFISLTFGDYTQVEPELLQTVARSADVLELRVDLLASLDPANVAHQVAMVRQSTFGTPLMYTVRSRGQGGKFEGTEEEYSELNQLGLQLCVELLDVECTWDPAVLEGLVTRKGPTLLVGSFHQFTRMLEHDELAAAYTHCMLNDAASLVKVVVKGSSREDNWFVQEVGSETVKSCCPFIGICTGSHGKLSKALNRVMCPATHPLLPQISCSTYDPELLQKRTHSFNSEGQGSPAAAVAASSNEASQDQQMYVEQVLEARRTLSLLGPSRQFAILAPWEGFADPSANSDMSHLYAKLLMASFHELCLPHVCLRVSAENAMEILRPLRLASTGGAIVLGPLRKTLHRSDEIRSDEVAQIAGQVDCVVRSDAGTLTGHCCQALSLKEFLLQQQMHLGAIGRVGLILGGHSSSAVDVALSGLAAVGFGRLILASPPRQDMQFTMTLDRSSGDTLGFEVSHRSYGDNDLLVLTVGSEGLVPLWNSRNPGKEVRIGYRLKEVNGVSDCPTSMVQQLMKARFLKVVVARCPRLSPTGVEEVHDLTQVARLNDVDVVVLTELDKQGLESIKGIEEVSEMMQNLNPMVVDMVWPKSEATAELLKLARRVKCQVVEASELLLNQVCVCTRLWTGKEAPREAIAKEILAEFAKLGELSPKALVQAAGVTWH